MTRTTLLLIALLPWLTDILFNKSLMASLLGNIIWGTALLISFLLFRIRDEKLRKSLHYFLVFLAGAWFSLISTSIYQHFDFAWNSRGLYWLKVLHGSLLASGFGSILTLSILSLLWTLKEYNLRNQNSRFFKKSLPSLEGLTRASSYSLNFAMLCWGFGLFFAIISEWLQLREAHTPESVASMMSFKWLYSPEIIGSFILWFVILFMNFVLKLLFSEANPLRYRSYLILSFCFIIIFIYIISSTGSYGRHVDIPWLAR